MTHPAPKRPLEVELAASASSSYQNGPVANGNKRRCNNSPFKDSSLVLTPLSDDITNMIEDAIQRNIKIENQSQTNSQTPLLTVHQTHLICEKLIKGRENRLRDEYDRVLACKLAEQYDILTKANYLNSYEQPSRAATIPTQTQQHQQTHTNSSSINALAAAFMRRNAAATAAAAAANTATNPLPDLSTFAASLTANGHPSALTTTHLAAFSIQQQAATAAAAIQHAQQHQHHQQQRLAAANANSILTGPVLLASNLDEQLAIPEALFTLFGVFGDVIRVKILFNKKDNALVQMADSNQAQVAQGYLDKQKVFGKVIRVTRSKHQLVQMPREGNQSDAGLTKDFTNSTLHRFKIPGSRNYLNIYPPSNTLHISNIPATTEESDILKAFKEACGFEYSSFKFFPKDRKMALMKFNTIEHAAIALIKMHNFQISDDNNLRVSFSKSVMQP